MDPVKYLEKQGWNNANNRITCRQIEKTGYLPTYLLTYRDSGPIGEYTANHIEDSLKPLYAVTKRTIRNAAIPDIIYEGMPKRTHYLTITCKLKPKMSESELIEFWRES
jgi:hypothetical protein